MSQVAIGNAPTDEVCRENQAWFIPSCTKPPARLYAEAIAVTRDSSDRKDSVDLQLSFHTLAEQWRNETAMLSSFSKLINHPAYQKIIAMGESVIPLILHELRDRPDHWFEALRAITKQTPVPVHERSSTKKAKNAWLK